MMDLMMLILGRNNMSDYDAIYRRAFEGGVPRPVGVNYNYEQALHQADDQVLIKEYGHPRPYLIGMPLMFRDRIGYYAIPFRSSMPLTMPRQVYYRMGENREDGRFAGLDFSSMIPIVPSATWSFNTPEENSSLIAACRSYDDILAAAQAYLDDYDNTAGYWKRVDLDLLGDGRAFWSGRKAG